MSATPPSGRRCAVLGGGGHAASVIDALLKSGHIPVGVLDSDASLWGQEILGIPVVGGDDRLAQLPADCFVVGLGMVVPGPARRRLFDRAAALGLEPLAVVHPRAEVAVGARIGPGAVVLAGACIGARASVGANAIVNTGAIVEHDCVVADHAHIASGACLCGAVTVGEGALVGAGAVVRQGERIGRHALVGCGSVVVSAIPDQAVAFGCPAVRVEP